MTLTQHFLSSCHYFAAVLFAFVFLFRVAFVHSSSVSFYLPAFFTIIFYPSSRSDSFYLLSFFQNQLRDIIARRCAMPFPAKKSLLSPTPRVHADHFPLPGKSVRTDVRYVITKFSGMDSLPNFLTHGAPLRARGSSAIILRKQHFSSDRCNRVRKGRIENSSVGFHKPDAVFRRPNLEHIENFKVRSCI